LGDTLRERGAEVCYAEVYRRMRPCVEVTPLLAGWADQVALVTATSDEILLNLVEMVGPAGRSLLVATPLVVVAERTAETARALGFMRMQVAERAEDAAILRALCALSGALTT
jgi:uroporphyrinogen-III synthase